MAESRVRFSVEASARPRGIDASSAAAVEALDGLGFLLLVAVDVEGRACRLDPEAALEVDAAAILIKYWVRGEMEMMFEQRASEESYQKNLFGFFWSCSTKLPKFVKIWRDPALRKPI